jgi:hypothetical protein
MKLCSIAWVVLILTILGMFANISLIGTNIKSIILDILFIVVSVYITNWACYSQCCNWIAWVLAIGFTLSFMIVLYAIRYKDDPEIRQIIMEARELQKKN